MDYGKSTRLSHRRLNEADSRSRGPAFSRIKKASELKKLAGFFYFVNEIDIANQRERSN